MCLIIAIISFVFAYNFYIDANIASAIVSGVIGLGFALLMGRNILKTKRERDMSKETTSTK